MVGIFFRAPEVPSDELNACGPCMTSIVHSIDIKDSAKCSEQELVSRMVLSKNILK